MLVLLLMKQKNGEGEWVREREISGDKIRGSTLDGNGNGNEDMQFPCQIFV